MSQPMNLPWKPPKYLDHKGNETIKENQNRVVWCSVKCSFWSDNFSKLRIVNNGGLVVCPHCGSPGSVIVNSSFLAMLQEMEKRGNKDYAAFIEERKEQCEGLGKNMLRLYREKHGGAADEGKYGAIWCAKKNFHPGEPVFLLRAQDPESFRAILDYASRCKTAGCSEEHIQACINHAQRIADWQKANPELVKARPD